MSQDQIEELEKELELIRKQEAEQNQRKIELMNKQRELLREEAERKRKEELGRPTEVRAVDFNGMYVNVKVMPDIRSDILGILQATRGRIYEPGAMVNRIPVELWGEFKDNLAGLENVKITHSLGIHEKINKFMSMPDYFVEIDGKILKVTLHPEANYNPLLNVPGNQWYATKRQFQIPLTEGYRLIDLLEPYTKERNQKNRGVVWTDAALRFVEKELEARTTLDTVATQEDAPDIGVTFKNGHELRPFQRVGIKFAALTRGRALNADQMGLGKTWQAVGYAEFLRAEREGLRVVVICPAHLKANWTREIYALTGEMPTVLQGRVPQNFDVATMLIEKPRWTVINYDIAATVVKTQEERTTDEKGNVHVKPPQDRWLWVDLINMSKPDLIVIDEAHYIKNTGSNRSKGIRLLQSEHRLALTGTPVLNRPGEFWATLNWLRPELFPSEEKFINQYTYNGRDAKNVQELRNLLKTVMIRRLKKDVVKELPPITRIPRMYELSEEHKAQYAKVLKGVYNKIDESGNKVEMNITSILAEIGKLKEVCAEACVPHTVELAMELMESEDNGHKVLIFSQYKEPVRMIARQLGAECLMWTGDTSFEERTRLEGEFQNNPKYKFLVISLMTGQTGLNLTAAGHVIFNDLYWTPAAHQQAEERAYGRLSNMHGADSYYMAAPGTITDWIQELLTKKLNMIEQVVEGINTERHLDVSIGMDIINRLRSMRP